MSLLEISGLVFEAGGTKVIDGLGLEVEAAEVHALLGTNGAGKSTLAYAIMGSEGYRPSSGTMVFDGRPINALMMHERAALGITLAWQEPARFEGMTVESYLTLKNKGRDPLRLLELVGLSPEPFLRRMVDRTLSGGERKRIELASVIASGPRLAILDEPDSGIDMLSLNDVIDVINAFREGGSAVLLITHRHEVASVADRASLLCRGKILCTGPPEEVAEYYTTRKCLLCYKRECLDV